jgi:hypothetical protein
MLMDSGAGCVVEMSDIPCGCRVHYDAEIKAFMREVCAGHMHNSDGTPLVKVSEPATDEQHLGRAVEKIKPKKGKR